MRIIHTADWHMGLRLGFVDRTPDLVRAITQVADICRTENADVLLICGDLFDGTTRTEVVRDWMRTLTETFRDFLAGNGTIVALTGNHDNENLIQILRHTMLLADPVTTGAGGLLRPGRFYLLGGPTFFRLAGRDGVQVQFVVMPSPTVARYDLTDAPQSPEDRNRALKTAFRRTLDAMPSRPGYEASKQTVLAAHICTAGAEVRADGRTVTEAGGVVLEDGELPTGYAYVALGDVHRPQSLMGLSHVRYSGSIDRMDLGESGEDKGVVVVDIGAAGRLAEPRVVPLNATPIYHVRIDDPPSQMPALTGLYLGRDRALVKLTLQYRAGRDNLLELFAELDGLSPAGTTANRKKSPTPSPVPAGNPMSSAAVRSKPSGTTSRHNWPKTPTATQLSPWPSSSWRKPTDTSRKWFPDSINKTRP